MNIEDFLRGNPRYNALNYEYRIFIGIPININNIDYEHFAARFGGDEQYRGIPEDYYNTDDETYDKYGVDINDIRIFLNKNGYNLYYDYTYNVTNYIGPINLEYQNNINITPEQILYDISSINLYDLSDILSDLGIYSMEPPSLHIVRSYHT